MKINKQKARELLDKYKSGTLSEDEVAILESWYNQVGRSSNNPPNDNVISTSLNEVWYSLSEIIKK